MRWVWILDKMCLPQAYTIFQFFYTDIIKSSFSYLIRWQTNREDSSQIFWILTFFSILRKSAKILRISKKLKPHNEICILKQLFDYIGNIIKLWNFGQNWIFGVGSTAARSALDTLQGGVGLMDPFTLFLHSSRLIVHHIKRASRSSIAKVVRIPPQ